jgi:hypothetical protein
MMQAKYPHLGTIGWDAMRLNNGDYVVFEGNTGFQRMDTLFCTTS